LCKRSSVEAIFGTSITNQARRQLREERQDVTALQLTADEHVAFRVDAVDLKDRLGHLQKPDFRRLIGGVLAIGQCGGDGTVDLDEVSTSRVLWFARFSV
jgi:uncharacterized protein with ACT and thioredoxin-like domain